MSDVETLVKQLKEGFEEVSKGLTEVRSDIKGMDDRLLRIEKWVYGDEDLRMPGAIDKLDESKRSQDWLDQLKWKIIGGFTVASALFAVVGYVAYLGIEYIISKIGG